MVYKELLKNQNLDSMHVSDEHKLEPYDKWKNQRVKKDQSPIL